MHPITIYKPDRQTDTPTHCVLPGNPGFPMQSQPKPPLLIRYICIRTHGSGSIELYVETREKATATATATALPMKLD